MKIMRYFYLLSFLMSLGLAAASGPGRPAAAKPAPPVLSIAVAHTPPDFTAALEAAIAQALTTAAPAEGDLYGRYERHCKAILAAHGLPLCMIEQPEYREIVIARLTDATVRRISELYPYASGEKRDAFSSFLVDRMNQGVARVYRLGEKSAGATADFFTSIMERLIVVLPTIREKGKERVKELLAKHCAALTADELAFAAEIVISFLPDYTVTWKITPFEPLISFKLSLGKYDIRHVNWLPLEAAEEAEAVASMKACLYARLPADSLIRPKLVA